MVDDIAENDPDRRAMVWCNPEGEEHVFTFADMKRWSDKTANYLAAHGVGRGDYVMVILRRHYQFWFVATALAKLGAVMVPATFMLKEHDLEYRLNGAVHQGRSSPPRCGDIADVVDNVAGKRAPRSQVKMLVNGAGGGLTPERRGGRPGRCRRRRAVARRGALRPGRRVRRARASARAGSTSTRV